jgi:hypothetical protein
MPRIEQRVSYSYTFLHSELRPLFETSIIYEKEDMLALLSKQQPQVEELMKKSGPEIMAQPMQEAPKKILRPKTEEIESKTYSLSYFNPETNKTEVLSSTSEVKIKDQVQMQIEESMASKSAFGIYSFVATPLMLKQVDPYLLEQILKNIDYETPPPFGAAPLVISPKAKVSEIVEVRRKEAVKEAIVEAVDRKEKVEAKIGEELILLEEAIKAIRKKKPIDDILAKLPPLTRARFEILLKRKKLNSRAIIELLKKDAAFLRAVRKKLEGMTSNELLGLVKTIASLIKR